MKKQITISEIVESKRLRSRCGPLDKDHIAGLAHAYESGEDVEPPRVWDVKGLVGFYLSRGRHRLAALRGLDRTRVECEVKSGTFEDALLDAVKGDIGNSLRRSNKDKRQCVGLLFAQFPNWSDRKIADAAGVAHTFVADCRVESDSTGPKKERKKPSIATHDSLVKLVRHVPIRSKADEWLAGVIQMATAVAEEVKEQ